MGGVLAKLHSTRLPRSFYARHPVEVAVDVLGKVLWHASPEGLVAVRIVEAEAYGGSDDPGSHGYRGMTARNASMFGPAGHLYVYFTYGMHYCLNLVTGREGECSAVLVRAGEPVIGTEIMRSRRLKARTVHDLCSGPAKLCEALGIDRSHDGVDLCEGVIGVSDLPAPIGGCEPSRAESLDARTDSEGSDTGSEDGSRGAEDLRIVQSVRVGLSTDDGKPWRFCMEGSPFVSRPWPWRSSKTDARTTGRRRAAEAGPR